MLDIPPGLEQDSRFYEECGTRSGTLVSLSFTSFFFFLFWFLIFLCCMHLLRRTILRLYTSLHRVASAQVHTIASSLLISSLRFSIYYTHLAGRYNCYFHNERTSIPGLDRGQLLGYKRATSSGRFSHALHILLFVLGISSMTKLSPAAASCNLTVRFSIILLTTHVGNPPRKMPCLVDMIRACLQMEPRVVLVSHLYSSEHSC